jgi:hypothetical protein
MINKLFNFLAICVISFLLLSNESVINLLKKDSVLKPNSSGKKNLDKNIISDPFTVDYSRYDDETTSYFKEIALELEFSDLVKTEPVRWTEDMHIFLEENATPLIRKELNRIVGELNELINPIEISIVNKKSEANCHIYFDDVNGFLKNISEANREKTRERLNVNCGYFSSGNNNAYLHIDLAKIDGDTDAQKHLLREELTQCLGLFNDSWSYPESMFYQGWTHTTDYAEIDKRLIDLLYN